MQKLVVSYRGKEYEAQYGASSGFVEVEVSWAGNHRKVTRYVGSASVEDVARIAALEMLRSAQAFGTLA